jgi:hypothetical protein
MQQTWREIFLKEVLNNCRNTGTAPLLQEVMLQDFQQWLRTLQEFSLSTEAYDSDIQQLIHQQNQIVWHQLFHGGYIVGWVKLQEMHYQSLQRDDKSSSTIKQTGERWLVNLILFVWDKWYTLWKQRNQELHGDDTLTQAAAERNKIQRQLQDIYQSCQDLVPRVQDLLFANVAHRYEVPLSVTQNWLAAHTGLISKSMRQITQGKGKTGSAVNTHIFQHYPVGVVLVEN